MKRPKRIQLKRTKGWRMPANTKKVDRSTMWGNPYRVAEGRTLQECLEMFRELMRNSPLLAQYGSELKGKNLACWCKPGSPCHADILLELVNQ